MAMTNEEIMKLRQRAGIGAIGSFQKTTSSASSGRKASDILKSIDSEVSVAQQSQPEKKGFGQKALEFGVENIISPVGRELVRPFASVARGLGFKGLQGERNPQAVRTPFGEVSPMIENKEIQGGQTARPGEAAMGAVNVALAGLPTQKVINPLFGALKGFVGGATKRAIGAVTGKGTDVVEAVIKNPKAAMEGLKGMSPEVLKSNAQELRTAISGISKQTKDEYGNVIKSLPKDVVGSKDKVVGFVTNKLKDKDFIIEQTKDGLKFVQTPLRSSEETILKDVFNVIDNWKDFTPKGIDSLAIKVGNYKKAGEQSKFLNTIIGGIKDDVRGYLAELAPQTKKAVTNYAEKQRFLTNLKSILNIKDKDVGEVGIRKTAEKIQNLFNSNKELAREAIEQLEGGADVISREAGRQLAQAPSRAQVSIGDTLRSVIQTVISPKAIGTATAKAGEILNSSQLNALQEIGRTLDKPTKLILINSIADLLNVDED